MFCLIKKKERIFRVFVCAGWVMCVVVFCSVVDKVKGSDSRFAFLALASEMFFPLFFTFCR